MKQERVNIAKTFIYIFLKIYWERTGSLISEFLFWVLGVFQIQMWLFAIYLHHPLQNGYSHNQQ